MTSAGEKTTKIILGFLLAVFAFAAVYPFLFVVSCSISDPQYVVAQSIRFFPKGFSVDSYKTVMGNSQIWAAYYNTIWYTAVGTLVNIVMTVMTAYPLSRKQFCLKGMMAIMITITMFFGGGLIPSFILVNKLGLYDTRWALILPGAVTAMNIIITRTYFSSLPEELMESAKIDGANDIRILIRIVLPLSKAILAVLTLFYAVGHWNSYFNALLYIQNDKLQPLQIFLMRVLLQFSGDLAGNAQMGLERTMAVEQLKYSSIVVTALPIICVYPFLQKYFVKGVMIGAIKA